MDPMTKAFVADVHRFAGARVPWVDFAKGQRKDDVMHEHLDLHRRRGGAVHRPGPGEDRAVAHRARRDATGDSYPWIVRATALVNLFYFYCVDADFGPFFLKFCTYFPYTAKLCINGNEWAKRQAAKAGIGFTAAGQRVRLLSTTWPRCRRSATAWARTQIDALLRKWLADPAAPVHPRGRAAGYRYELSVLQAEFSLTQMLDRPVSGRIFFEQVMRDNLDIGRPDQVSLVFDRRICAHGPPPTPGRFRTRVITDGVIPCLHIDYKNTKIKQYHNCDARSHAMSEYVGLEVQPMLKT